MTTTIKGVWEVPHHDNCETVLVIHLVSTASYHCFWLQWHNFMVKDQWGMVFTEKMMNNTQNHPIAPKDSITEGKACWSLFEVWRRLQIIGRMWCVQSEKWLRLGINSFILLSISLDWRVPHFYQSSLSSVCFCFVPLLTFSSLSSCIQLSCCIWLHLVFHLWVSTRGSCEVVSGLV